MKGGDAKEKTEKAGTLGRGKAARNKGKGLAPTGHSGT